MPSINLKINITASRHKVYESLTSKKGLTGWWTTEVSGTKPGIGHVHVFHFCGGARTEMEIIELIDNEKIEWKCLDSLHEWIGTHVVFRLRQRGHTVQLEFAHTNWRDDTEFFTICANNWVGRLESLRAFCETGKGRPLREKAMVSQGEISHCG